MSGYMRDELLRRLQNFDEEVSLMFDENERFRMVIVGGGALILMDLISRATHDIDILESSSSTLNGLMEQYDINGRVNAYLDQFPYNYLDRLKPVQGLVGCRIDFYTASLEDIVIAKLYSNRDTDYKDITDPNILASIDWELLHDLATSEGEAKQSAINERRYREFLDAYSEYERRYRPCDS